MDRDSDLDDQYHLPLSTEHPPKGLEPSTPHTSRLAQCSRLDCDVRDILIEQMDQWIWELDEINETIKNGVSETLPAYLSSRETDSDLDTSFDLDKTLALDSGFGADDEVSPGDSHGYDSPVVENGHDETKHIPHTDLNASFSSDTSDDDSFNEQSTPIENGWARLRQIQRHIDFVKSSLFETSDCHTFKP